MQKGLIVAGLTVLISSQLAFAETVEDVLAKMGEITKKHKTMQYKMKSVTKMEQQQMTSESTMEANLKYMRTDDSYLMRNETVGSTEMTLMGQKQSSKTKMTQVVDGKYNWMYSEVDSSGVVHKNLIKDKIGTIPDPASTDSYKQFEIKLLPEETVDGKKTWVMEMTPRNPQIKMVSPKSIQWIDQKTGMPIKNIAYDTQGKPMTTTTYTDIKINEKIAPETFKYEPPAGVTVTDKTK